MISDAPRDDRSSSDDSTSAYANTRQDDGSGTYPRTFKNVYSAERQRRMADQNDAVIDLMPCREDLGVRPDQHIVGDVKPALPGQIAADIDMHAVADEEPGIHILPDATHDKPDTRVQNRIRPNRNELTLLPPIHRDITCDSRPIADVVNPRMGCGDIRQPQHQRVRT